MSDEATARKNGVRVCVGELAALYRTQGQGRKAIETLDSFRGLLGLIARKDQLTLDARMQAAKLGYALASLYEEQRLFLQAAEISCLAESLSGIPPETMHMLAGQDPVYVTFVRETVR